MTDVVVDGKVMTIPQGMKHMSSQISELQALADLRPVFVDRFQRAPTAAGVLGAGWVLKGPYVASYPLPAATGGEVSAYGFTCANGAIVYAMRKLRAPAKWLRAEWSWVDDGVGTQFTTLAMIITNSDANLVDNMLHITIINGQLQVQKRVAGGAFVDMLPDVAISPTLLLAGVPHVATVYVDDSTVRVTIDDIVDVSVTDPDVPLVVGSTIAVEHYSASSDVRYPMTIHAVSAG
jgi:hypothetical protein